MPRGGPGKPRPGRRKEDKRDANGHLMWDPDKRGKKNYPRTEEAFNRRRDKAIEAGKKNNYVLGHTRLGVPDGFGGKKSRIPMIRAMARVKGEELLNMIFKFNEQPREPLVVEAFRFYAERMMAVDPESGEFLYPDQARERAAAKLLDMLHQKPAQKQDVRVSKQEDFLDLLSNMEAQSRMIEGDSVSDDPEETTGSSEETPE